MATINGIGTPAIVLGGPLTFSGAFSFTATLTNTTAVTFPTSGTLATTSQVVNFVTIAGTTQAAAVNTGYVVSNASQTTITLPATAALGSVVAIVGTGAAGWILAANTAQTIKAAGQTTSSAGSLASGNAFDCIEVVCTVANTTWVARSMVSAAGLTIA
jgi:hypothetical protein